MIYWIDDKQIIVATSDNLLFGNYSKKDLNLFKAQLDNDVIPSQLTGISLNYIKRIEKNEKYKTIDFELGKSSGNQIKFHSKSLRDSVFEHLTSNIALSPENPNPSEVWNDFWKLLLLIIALSAFLLYGKTLDLNDVYISPKGAFGFFLVALVKMVDNIVIITISVLAMVGAFLLSKQRLKDQKFIKRLVRK